MAWLSPTDIFTFPITGERQAPKILEVGVEELTKVQEAAPNLSTDRLRVTKRESSVQNNEFLVIEIQR